MNPRTRKLPAGAGSDAVKRAGETETRVPLATDTAEVASHPARYTPAIIDELAPIITRFGLDVHDPFAGTGERLGTLCDRLGIGFTGSDLEAWPGADARVRRGDATDPARYPKGDRLIVTSPTYGNGVNDHHEARDSSRRYTYRSSLGRPLHENNTGRYGLRRGASSWARYWALHRQAVVIWREREWPVLVNVKAFVHAGKVVDLPDRWTTLLAECGYAVTGAHKVRCPGIRHGANSAARVDHEVILTAAVIP